MKYDILLTNFDLEISYFSLCFFAFYSVTYLFCKSCSINRLKKSQWIYIIIVGVSLSLFYTFLKRYNDQLSQLVMYGSIPLLVSTLNNDRFVNNLFKAIISLGLFHVSKSISSIIVATVLYCLGINVKILLAHIANMMISFLLCILFMHIKRFKAGFQYFQNDKHLGLGLTISGIIILLSNFSLREYSELDALYAVVIFGAIVSGCGLYLWIKRSITARYREKLQLQSEEHYQQLLSEQQQENEKLNQTNEYLAKIVHRDNHLMNSLNTAIDVYFDGNDKAMKNDLFRELQTMVKERGELIGKEQRESKLLPSTGSLLIDNTVSDLFIKAAAHGIEFDLTVSTPVDEIIGKYISQTELQTLLSDHIKDAVIAVESRGEDKGKILVDLSMQNESYCITIYDSGVEFDIDTLSKLGAEQVTTHADSGGSGIGFMTTFETLRKAYASLIITEFENQAPFTKSVTFRFDGENNYIIQSCRSAELKERIQRDDVMIL